MVVQADSRLSLDDLDSLEQWAHVLLEEGDDDGAGSQLLMLLRERIELGELIRRDEGGQLSVLVRVQQELEQAHRDVESYRKTTKDAREACETYRRENIELRKSLDGFAALLKKVETLLSIARHRIEGGEDPGNVVDVADGVFKQEAGKPQLYLQKIAKKVGV